MKIKINKKNGVTEIPEGYRVIEDFELLKELRTNEELITLAKEGWIYVNTSVGIRTAGFYYYYSVFYVNGDYYTYYDPACSRGVFVKLGDDEEMTITEAWERIKNIALLGLNECSSSTELFDSDLRIIEKEILGGKEE